ncbi:MAG: glycoside hydrolase family 88 protein [Bacteroidaceae bacterium]|nr:glycoside hydrolase family 88 protein [Bacteroidaceae bacterium]
MKKNIIAGCITALILTGCATSGKGTSDWYDAAVDNAAAQMALQIAAIESDTTSRVLNPVTTRRNRFSTAYCGYADWRSGFFPGSVWYLYELTGDSALVPLAEKYTEAIAEARHLTSHHDIGFIINCSYGNGRRFIKPAEYDSVLVTAARSLCTRFRPGAGIIQSWNASPGTWQASRGWTCPVIIDNMMNLELLFEAAKISGDSTLRNVAVSHANTTLREHFRPDGSCYHVIDYNPETGEVQHRMTGQGYADESSWARGQAWAIYGYTMCYRETGDRRYLDQAVKTFGFMRDHRNMPADKIPYWDMDAPDIPNEPRDASTAAIIASALYELSGFPVENAASYRAYADEIMASLASDEYTAKLGENGRFILKHSTGSIPHNSEIDVPLNYADYYYLEALKRKHDIEHRN